MQRRFARSVAGVLAVLLALVLGIGTAAADPTPAPGGPAGGGLPISEDADADSDDLPNPLEAERRDLRDRALRDVLSGRREAITRNGSRVVKLGTKQARPTPGEQGRVGSARPAPGPRVDQYVELSRTRTAKIFVILVEFGNERLDRYPDVDTDPNTPGPVRFDGPLHNTIPAPDRRRDNTTIWRPDFARDYYRKLYFGDGAASLKSYYERQSSGRYSVSGEVSDWVKVRYNEARYGRSNGYPCEQNVCANTWYLIQDALAQWVAGQAASGRTPAEIKKALSAYDAWDRYDHDGDSNFNEADGYLDHFQIVHAGGDQSDGDPYQGEDAIWSHRWYAYFTDIGRTGPPQNLRGGSQIPGTDLWVGDYTMQAENAGLSVFAHEYGHDLGLPDHYDTAVPGDNAVNWWTLMGQSRLKAERDVGVGTRPADLGVWDKLQLGWLDYSLVDPRQARTVELGPHEYNSAKDQAVIMPLPPKVTALPTPAGGNRQWWSGAQNSANTGLTGKVVLPAQAARLTFAANYNIEDCGANPCDAAYVEVDDGKGFAAIKGNITRGDQNFIAGRSAGWVTASFDLSAFAGKTVLLRFRYATNACDQGQDLAAAAGLLVDDITITAGVDVVFADGGEDGQAGWTPVGFSNVSDAGSDNNPHFYLASYRSYVSYDRHLRTGPYNLGWQPDRPLKAEFFPYQSGLLVNYWNTRYCNNDSSRHPGHGRILPVDAHPETLYSLSENPWRGRIQTYDAPFSLRRADSFVLHHEGRPSLIRGAGAQPLFDDTRSYWSPKLPLVGVKVAGAGVTMRVLSQTRTSMTVQLGR